MQQIVVIRPNYYSNLHMLHALKSIHNANVMDIYSINQLKINELNSDGQYDIRFKGKHIDRFDKILFYDTPNDIDYNLPINRYESYINNERNSAIKSGLYMVPDKVINFQLKKDFSYLQNKSDQLKLLKKLNWKIPTANYTYLQCNEEITNIKIPDSTAYAKHFLVVSQHTYFIHPINNIIFENHNKLEKAIECTQVFLRENHLNWLVIPFINFQGDFYAYGLNEIFPPESDNLTLRNFIEESINCG